MIILSQGALDHARGFIRFRLRKHQAPCLHPCLQALLHWACLPLWWGLGSSSPICPGTCTMPGPSRCCWAWGAWEAT